MSDDVVCGAAAEPLRVPKVSLETTQKLCLSASRDAGTPWCWDGAVVAVLQGRKRVEKKSVVSGSCCGAFEGAKGQSRNHTKDCA